MKKKILIIGNGVREYALAKKMSENYSVYVAPESDTLKEFANCLDIREDDVNGLLEFVLENEIDLTIPISQKSLDADIVNKFTEHKQTIFGPTAKSCEAIFNKASAKKTLYKLRIPTPKFGIFEKQNLANDYIKNLNVPFVIKTNDTNSATIITSAQTAKNIIEYSLTDKKNKVIIEDYIYGTSFSFYAITDGYKALPIGSSINYRHSLDGDGGQLTSGMASCVPNYKLSISNEYYLMDSVIYPTLEYLDSCDKPYQGIIGVNGIITDEGKLFILGWQNFMQDSDAAGILKNMEEDFYNLFFACAIGSFSDEYDTVNIKNNSSVSLVLACKNKNNTENVISGIDKLDDRIIVSYYPSVTKNKYLEFEANNGAVLIITAPARTVAEASSLAYSEIKNINFNGILYRKDICQSQ